LVLRRGSAAGALLFLESCPRPSGEFELSAATGGSGHRSDPGVGWCSMEPEVLEIEMGAAGSRCEVYTIAWGCSRNMAAAVDGELEGSSSGSKRPEEIGELGFSDAVSVPERLC
jgi:hypothetical protein